MFDVRGVLCTRGEVRNSWGRKARALSPARLLWLEELLLQRPVWIDAVLWAQLGRRSKRARCQQKGTGKQSSRGLCGRTSRRMRSANATLSSVASMCAAQPDMRQRPVRQAAETRRVRALASDDAAEGQMLASSAPVTADVRRTVRWSTSGPVEIQAVRCLPPWTFTFSSPWRRRRLCAS